MGQIIGLFFIRREENDCAARGAAIIVTTAAVSIYKEEWPSGNAKGTAFASALPAETAICQIGVQELADRTAAQGHFPDGKGAITRTVSRCSVGFCFVA